MSEQTIIGTITTAEASPIAGANVELYDTEQLERGRPLQKLVSDSEGKYALDGSVLNGEYWVRATKEGFLPKELNIHVGAEKITYPDIWLEAEEKPAYQLTIDIAERKPLQMKFGFNEYVIESFPFHPFNDPAYVSAMKQSGATVMRFPGGTIANFYNWVNDDFMIDEISKLSPADSVPRDRFATEDDYWAMVSKFSNYLQNYINKGSRCTGYRGSYGYEAFRDMTEKIGAEIVYVGNISLAPGGADPVDHLVAWMQKLKNEGTDVKYLELGNEVVTPAGARNVQAIPNGLYDLDKYMRVAETAARAIKEIFPNIQIGILADGLGNKIGDHAGEIDLLCRRIAGNYPSDFYDAVVIHSYLRTTDRNEEGLQIRKDKLLAQSKQIVDNSIDHWRSVFPGKQIWMTETGYIAGTKEDEAHFTGNMCTAVLEADYLLRWVDHDDLVTSFIKFFSIGANKNVKSAMFWNNETNEIVRNPNSYMYGMIAGAVQNSSHRLCVKLHNNDGYLVKTASWVPETDGSGHRVPGKGRTQTVNVEVETITARAFLSADGNSIYVPFVNKSQASRDMSIQVKGMDLRKAVTEMRSINGEIESANTLTEPHNVIPAACILPADRIIRLPAFSVGVIEIRPNE